MRRAIAVPKRRLSVSETHAGIARETRATQSRKSLPAPGRKTMSNAGTAAARTGIGTAPSAASPLPRLAAVKPTACERQRSSSRTPPKTPRSTTPSA
eukprot:3855411-Pleurochrysis_carterae.AAC.1